MEGGLRHARGRGEDRRHDVQPARYAHACDGRARFWMALVPCEPAIGGEVAPRSEHSGVKGDGRRQSAEAAVPVVHWCRARGSDAMRCRDDERLAEIEVPEREHPHGVRGLFHFDADAKWPDADDLIRASLDRCDG
jgi:hypothetical protein